MNSLFVKLTLRVLTFIGLTCITTSALANVTLTQQSGNNYLLDWPGQPISCMNANYNVKTIINGSVANSIYIDQLSYTNAVLPDPIAQSQSVTYQVFHRICSPSGGAYLFYGESSITINAVQQGVLLPPSPSLTFIPSEDTTTTSIGMIGGQFRVDESGAATYNLPLALPNAPGNIKPNLSVSYSSSGGNGMMGIGWNLGGLSAISRCRKTTESFGEEGANSVFADSRFCLDGQPLVLVSGTYGSADSQYITEIFSGSRITLRNGMLGNPDTFEVEKQDGSAWLYGQNDDAKIFDHNSRSVSWMLSKIEDNVGNQIVYNYDKSSGSGQGENEVLIESIEFGGNTILFTYNSSGNRADTYTRFVLGAKVQTKALLTDIVIKNHSYTNLSSYHFSYSSSQANNRNTKLESITQCDGARSGVCLFPDEFDYTHPGNYSFYASDITLDLYNSDNVYASFPVDLNGDGYTDWVYATKHNANTYRLNIYKNNGALGTVSFSVMDTEYISGSGLTADNFRIATIDYNNDGEVDLLVPKTVSGVTKWFTYQYKGAPEATNMTYSKNAAIADMNGDGWVDVLNGSVVYENNGGIFTSKTVSEGNLTTSMPNVSNPLQNIQVEYPDAIDLNGDGSSEFYIKGTVYGQYPNYSGEDYYFLATIVPNGSNYQYELHWYSQHRERVQYADINSDGITDMFEFDESSNKWRYRLSSGGTLQSWVNINLTQIDNAKSVQIIDVDADGNPEITYLDESQSKWRAYTYMDGSWHSRIYQNLPGNINHSGTSTGMADFDGNGRADIYNMNSNSNKIVKVRLSTTPGIAFAEPMDKLSTIENGFGIKTSIKYASMLDSSNGSIGNVYTKGAQITAPMGNGSAVIAPYGPMYLVRKVSTDSPGYSGSSFQANNTVSVEYAYEGLRMQAGGRGSLGFKKLSTKDLQTSVITETTYHQEFPYIGMPITTQTVHNGNVIGYAHNSSFQTIAMKSVGGESNGRSYFPYVNIAEENNYVVDSSSLLPNLLGNTKTITTYEGKSSANSPLYAVVKNIEVSSYNDSNQPIKRITTDNKQFDDDVSKWWINRISETEVTHEIFAQSGSPQDTITRTSLFSYNTQGMLETESVGSTESDKLTTLHCYAGNGMKLATISHSKDIAASCDGNRPSESSFTPTSTSSLTANLNVFRESRVNYSADYRYVVNTIDSLGQNLTYASHPNKWSQPQTVKYLTDFNGNEGKIVEKRFSRFGGLYFSRDNTGQSQHTVSRLASQSSSIGAPAIAESYYYVQKNDVAGKTPVYAYFDKLGRKVATVHKGFSGNYIYQYQRYDIDGRANKSSAPSFQFTGDGWTTNYYDALGRVSHSTDANGTTNAVSLSKHGAHSRTTYTTSYTAQGAAKSIVKEELYNVIGDLLVVDDDNNGSLDITTDSLRFTRDATGNLLQVTNVDGLITQTMTYDNFGRKKTMFDISKGNWGYSYNALGELVTQTTPLNDEKYVYRDIAGRKIEEWTKIANNNTIEKIKYSYDVGSVSYFTLQSESLNVGTSLQFQKLYDYDVYNRLDWVKTKIGASYYVQQTTFDEHGRLFQKFDPQVRSHAILDRKGCFDDNNNEVGDCRGVQYQYSQDGYLIKQTESDEGLAATGNDIFYEVLAVNALGKVTSVKKGQHITVTNQFNDATGLITNNSVRSGSTVIQDNDYDFDGVGTLRQRERFSLTSSSGFYSEQFTYDVQNRLTHIDNVLEAQYYANGNIKWKRAVDNGTSRYFCYRSENPYAVSGLGANGCTTDSYGYDEKGNMETGKGRTITYSHFDKATKIEKGSDYTDFHYDSSRNRYKRIDKVGSTTKETHYVGNIEIIYTAGVSQVQTRRYIPGGVINQYGDSTPSINFEHKDHIGSANTITDGNGNIVSKTAFDAWGKRYVIPYSQWSTMARSKAATQVFALNDLIDVSRRGFTGHEHVENMDIVHMNGRIYDPTLGRFLQADPFIQAPLNSQNYNRYSYVLNNPMSMTDPSGYFFKSLFKKLNKALGDFAPLLGIALLAIPGIREWTLASGWHAALFGFGTGGVATGSLKGALIGAFSGAAFHQIGGAFTEASGFFAEGGFGHILTHGVTGGITSVLSGGKFGHGFLSAGLTKALNINKMIGTAAKDASLRVMTAAIVGGTISKITGGKFANGATTAAFAQALNGESAAEAEEQYKKASAEIQKEIHDDALNRRDQLGTLIKDKNWSEIRELYPHLANVSDNNMYIQSLNLQQEFHYMAGRTISGKIFHELDAKLGKPLKLALEVATDRTPRGVFGSLVGFFHSTPPPLQHQFVYERNIVEIEFVRRRYD
jgi:RHS repeat-associated protein